MWSQWAIRQRVIRMYPCGVTSCKLPSEHMKQPLYLDFHSMEVFGSLGSIFKNSGQWLSWQPTGVTDLRENNAVINRFN